MPPQEASARAAAADGGRAKTEFAKRNPTLEKLVPDALENAVDALLPDSLEKVLDRGCEHVYDKYQNFKTDLAEGVGEVAGVLYRVAKHAWETFHIHDLVFGVYQLALHHATVNAGDSVTGELVHDEALIRHLLEATDAASAAYIPDKAELCKALGIPEASLLRFEPDTSAARPAFAVWADDKHKRIVWGFRGTTDLNDMLTDACASCVPYCGGFAHWGMLQASTWMVENELRGVVELVKARPGYELLLVGHSLGAGTATMLAHMMQHDPEATAAAAGIKFSAVGIATPAVLTQELAEGCGDTITSIVLMHDIVPRFSIHSVFELKREMDATKWGDILAATAADWAVPDVIEKSETYQRLAKQTQKQWRSVTRVVADGLLGASSWFVSGLHFVGLAKPNPQVQPAQPSTAAATTAQTARAAMSDPAVIKDAVSGVAEQMSKVAKEDVHRVYAPGRLFFIRRLDKHTGRAKYGSTVHRCVLCEDDAALPPPEEAVEAEACANGSAAGPAQQRYELIEAGAKQRFGRIVLRETCLLDHLTGGYEAGLKFALAQAQARSKSTAAAAE